jgi:hypothetical protein
MIIVVVLRSSIVVRGSSSGRAGAGSLVDHSNNEQSAMNNE